MRRFWLSLFAFVALAAPALAEPRIALVIGNSNYGGDLPKLPNPANDADLMAATLKKLGFKVVESRDADLNQMNKAIREFSNMLSSAGSQAVGLFFYAGHGLQIDGENWLIPIKANIQKSADAEFEAVPASKILGQMQFAENSLNIVILDACRNNPLSRGMRSASTGLAKMDAPLGSFIAYSTAPGQTAADGKGKNSPYTAALAKAMLKPGIAIEEAFRDARVEVLQTTNKEQIPWESSSLTGAFSFNPGQKLAETQTAAIAPAPAPAPAAAQPAAPSGPAKGCTNCPEMVAIKGGSFMMGSPDDEDDRKDFEGPQKKISIKPFSMGKYSVTVGQFAEFIKATKYKPSDECDTERTGKMRGANWTDPEAFDQGENEPVVCINWKDANAYAEWLAVTSGKPYRLPSEAEWEYAARAGVTKAHYWSDESDTCAYANVADKAAKKKHANWSISDCNDGFAGTSPVGSLKPNAFGLYDMLGNVKQWVAGCGVESIEEIPADGSPTGGSCSYRPVRGSAWDSLPNIVRFAYWERGPASYASSNYGFRVALGQ
ncbi:SUMF1/EgtB/PvdO family nonheme iron enzyme [Dongia sedimenti]|uniref:SUMF1/EgtB/PvdO family nonheme iron enzyme n=1 Tax=Dongia sedimenti TaxID=3064282 RepID=A0ABU0YQR4_9PROT|nr:SUMF1/EgtB/PvdO family nonheme iron enzyme [Rhodospirillaceae bacterium R-7]